MTYQTNILSLVRDEFVDSATGSDNELCLQALVECQQHGLESPQVRIVRVERLWCNSCHITVSLVSVSPRMLVGNRRVLKCRSGVLLRNGWTTMVTVEGRDLICTITVANGSAVASFHMKIGNTA